MTAFTVRVLPTAAPSERHGHLLDWAPGKPAATIHTNPEFFRGWRAPRAAADLLLLGAAVYCADRAAPRRYAADAWTRDLHLNVPVADSGTWPAAALQNALGFLSGDHWTLTPHQGGVDPQDAHGLAAAAYRAVAHGGDVRVDAVCLFSGGLDSLCGVIDLLTDDPALRLCLVSHYEGGQASAAQQQLHTQLRDAFGDRITWRRLFLRPAAARREQARPLPGRRENTTRSRSFLFVTAALALAASQSAATPVILPENGYIGINVPLTRARVGSLSTRTTHPRFLDLLRRAAREAQVHNPIENPYQFRTKGDMLAGSRNPALLRRLAPLTVSCSHPEASRWRKRPQGNCGYCFPCLIRRASMSRAGWDQAADYAWDAHHDTNLLDPRQGTRGSDLRAVILGTRPDRPDSDLHRNGPVPAADRGAYLDVWRRGNHEVRTWLRQHASAELRQRLDAAS